MFVRKQYMIELVDGRVLFGSAHRKGDLIEALERWGIHRSEVDRITREYGHEWEREPAPTKWRKATVNWYQ